MSPDYGMNDYNRLRAALQIDLLRLGEEIVEFPMQLQEAGELCAGAVAASIRAENALKEITAKAADGLRGMLVNDKAPSEASINSRLPRHKAVMAAKAEQEAAMLDQALWVALVSSMRAKQSALKQASEMTVAGYLAPNAAYNTRKKEMHEGRQRLRAGRE